MAAALITALSLSIAGLCGIVFFGFASQDVFRHATFAVFVTLMLLLSHSMTMFYLIGKGKAIRDAASEAGLSTRYADTIAALRRPVFKHGSLAMFVTILAALLGGAVDTGMLPVPVHWVLAAASVGSNLKALKEEVAALTAATRITREVDALILGASRS